MPETVRLPLAPPTVPEITGVPSPQSMVDVKLPGCELGLESLNEATTPLNTDPAFALNGWNAPAMSTSETVISPVSAPVWPLVPVTVMAVL